MASGDYVGPCHARAYNPTEFPQQVAFPDGIISCASKTDGGRGINHVWAVGNVLREDELWTYCGLMVRTDNWQQKWYGKLNKAKFAIVRCCPTRTGSPRRASTRYWRSCARASRSSSSGSTTPAQAA